jgi:hypothetical protein
MNLQAYYSRILTVFQIIILTAILSCNDEYECTPIYEFNFLSEHHNLPDKESGNFGATIRTYNVDSIIFTPTIFSNPQTGQLDTIWNDWHYLNMEDKTFSIQVSATFYESGKFSISYDHPDSIISEGTWDNLSYERYKDVYKLGEIGYCPMCPSPDSNYELAFANGKVGYVEVYERFVEACFTLGLKPHIVLHEFFIYEENGTSYRKKFSVILDSSSIPVNGCYYRDCGMSMGGMGF